MRVLLADDSRVMRQIIIRTLRQAGWRDWRIVQAEDGAQALAMVLAAEPDLVLSDWNMPELTGIELLRTLRLRGYQTPFCFITSEGSPEMHELAAAAGALGLVTKPFTAESFRAALDGTVPVRSEEAPATSRLPSSMAVRELLERLLGREVETVACPPPVTPTAVLGLYVCDRDRMTAVLTLDLPLAAYLSSGLALLPPAVAEAAIADGELPPDLAENIGEVLNVLAIALNEHSATHQRLYRSYLGADAPADASAHSKALGNRLDLVITVPGYGTGTLSWVLVG